VDSGTSLQATQTASMFSSPSARRVIAARSARVLSRGSPVASSKTLMQVIPGMNQVWPLSMSMARVPSRFHSRVDFAQVSSAARTTGAGIFGIDGAGRVFGRQGVIGAACR
jgi:hypothetical protein